MPVKRKIVIVHLEKSKHLTNIAPLITFRILFGAVMLFGTIRFMANGWIEKLYLEPQFFFKFYGFEWVKVLDSTGMYWLFTTMAVSAVFVMLGLFYRWAIVLFFLSFTYVELLDASNYLNHYYLVCLLAFLLIFLPANRAFSLDVWRNPTLKVQYIPAWNIYILMLQLGIVYFCAGLAKVNTDWLFRAMPLAVWLPEHTYFPIIGQFFNQTWVAYLFSWGGALYDLSIAFFLLHPNTRSLAYLLVIVFHIFTKMLFNIGLFPVIMISSTLIFFSASFHKRLLFFIGYQNKSEQIYQYPKRVKPILKAFMIAYVLLQLFLPFRHVFYPNNVLWAEEGYRFSWRVMLVEKVGLTTFYVHDPATKRKTEIINAHYLTPFQEKQMSIQADFILQFAHFLKEEYQTYHQIKNPVVTVDAFVALNGRTSQRLIDPNVNLAAIEDNFLPKKWILGL